jgi:hypothetical protein
MSAETVAAAPSAVAEPPVYRRSRRYRRFVWLALIGRLGLLACVLWMVLLAWFPRIGWRIYPPGWWNAVFFSLFGVLAVGRIASMILAEWLRCDACGQWAAGGWIIDWRRPFRANFILPELTTGRFRCEHCGTEFQLSESGGER